MDLVVHCIKDMDEIPKAICYEFFLVNLSTYYLQLGLALPLVGNGGDRPLSHVYIQRRLMVLVFVG